MFIGFIALPRRGRPKYCKTMKKILTLLGLAVGTALPASAQKLVIGSRIPDLKAVQWLTAAPRAEAPMLIEFYDPDNASSVRFFPRLADIRHKYGTGKAALQIVVIAAQPEAAEKLVRDGGGRYCIGVDAEGKVCQAFNVRFLPYTILADSKGVLYWQGNLGNLTDAVLQKVR